MNDDIKILKESVDTLIDENKRLRERIEILEASKKQENLVNEINDEIRDTLDKILRDYKQPNTLDTQLDDWSYKPSIGTQGPVWIGYPSWWGVYPPYYGRGPVDVYGNPVPYCNYTDSTGNVCKDGVHVTSRSEG